MVNTRKEYEVSDIDFDGNKMHAQMMIELTISLLVWSTQKRTEGADKATETAETDKSLKSTIASILDMRERQGWVLTRTENVSGTAAADAIEDLRQFIGDLPNDEMEEIYGPEMMNIIQKLLGREITAAEFTSV